MLFTAFMHLKQYCKLDCPYYGVSIEGVVKGIFVIREWPFFSPNPKWLVFSPRKS